MRRLFVPIWDFLTGRASYLFTRFSRTLLLLSTSKSDICTRALRIVVLATGLSGPGSSRSRGHCVLFLPANLTLGQHCVELASHPGTVEIPLVV